jgi:serine/threonine-protein kinase HipA
MKGLVYFQDMLASLLVETDEGYEFSYQADYLENKNAKPVSLTLPLSVQKYESKVLFSFFDGLIPEGGLLDMATTYWKLKRND